MAQIKDVKFPTITTLSVEVKALRIGKKQCTISVFKQLPEVKLTFSNYKDVTLWGVVKYKELFVVYQKENTLITSPFPKKKALTVEEVFNKFEKDYYTILTSVMENFEEEKDFEKETGFRFYDGDDDFMIKNSKKARDFVVKNEKSIELTKDYIVERNEQYADWNNFVKQCKELDQLFIAV